MGVDWVVQNYLGMKVQGIWTGIVDEQNVVDAGRHDGPWYVRVYPSE
jgi:hypothetical protein